MILTYQLKIKYKNRLKKRLEQKSSKYQDDIEKLKALLKEEKRRQDKMTFDELLENTCKLVKMSAEIEEVSKKNANLQRQREYRNARYLLDHRGRSAGQR